jgi:hypothetical protein
MKARIQFLLLAFAVAFASCSEDDSVPNNTLAGDNGFEFNRTAYVTEMVYITEDNEIIFSSRDITNGSAVQVDVASFTTLNGELTEKTYGVNNGLTSCAAIVEGTWNNGEVQDGDNILGEENAQGGFMRIVHYDAFDKDIKIIFEFTRKDGKLVAGTYTGGFTRLTL